MKSPLQILDRTLGSVTGFMNGLASFWIFLLTIAIVTDVVGRSIFNHPLTGTPELVKVSLVAIVFLEITHTLREGRHVRSTIILSRVSPGAMLVLDGMANLLGMVLFTFLCYSSWPLTVTAWSCLEYEGEGALCVPTYPVRTIILVTSALMVIQYGIFLIDDVRSGLAGTKGKAS
jgi:TRAP-type mannitol/chloroaromatic compound transport system permease small subunit